MLVDDRVIGRIDLKTDRQAGVLRVQSAWVEPGSSPAELAARVEPVLRRASAWQGLGDVIQFARFVPQLTARSAHVVLEVPAALEALSDFWTALGSKVELMDAAHHDLVLAVTSHIPHLIAYTIVGTASDLEDVTQSEVIKYSAGGFRDFTRIAASDPVMWRDVFLTNKGAVLEMLGRFTEDLTALQRAIRSGDGDTLFDLFTRTRAIRRGIIEAGQDTAAPDFGRVAPTSGGGGGNPA